MTHRLELFVSGDSVRSRAARRRLERLCESRMAGDYELAVIDLEADPAAGGRASRRLRR